MGLRYNVFNGSFDFTRSPGSYLDGEVATFADLPLDTAAAPLNSAWLVRQGSGLWLLTRKPAGIYIRTATGGTDRNADYTYASAFPDVFSDANLVVYNDADSTKNVKLSAANLTTGTTRTLTVPDKSGTLATTDAGDMATGTLADARLSSNVPLKDAANTYSANQTLNGTNNVAPNQTAASGSSIMTRDLVDAQASLWIWFQQIGSATSVNNGAMRFMGPARQHNFSTTLGVLIPPSYKKFRVVWWGGWTTVPTTASFPTYVRFHNPSTLNNNPVETDHGARFGQTVYPDTATGLAGTLTNVGTFSFGGTTHNVFRYVSDTITIPAGWQTNAAANGGYSLIGFVIANDSGGTLQDAYAATHGFQGYMEFLK